MALFFCVVGVEFFVARPAVEAQMADHHGGRAGLLQACSSRELRPLPGLEGKGNSLAMRKGAVEGNVLISQTFSLHDSELSTFYGYSPDPRGVWFT